MRVETKRLLDRLGQPEFQYREYGEAQASQVERWPLFELMTRQLHPSRGMSGQRPGQDLSNPDKPSADNSIQSLASRISSGLNR